MATDICHRPARTLTVSLGTVDAEEVVVSPQDAIPVLHPCLCGDGAAIDTRPTRTHFQVYTL